MAKAFSAAYGVDRGEEALGEALAYAWEHRSALGEMTNPAGYLYRVGQSRTRRFNRLRPDLPAPEELGLPLVEPGLAPALRKLSSRQRTCVALVIGHHWTHQETAELLGLSRSSVQNHVERGMEHLRAALGVTDDQRA